MQWLLKSIINDDFEALKAMLKDGEPEIQLYLITIYELYGLIAVRKEVLAMRHKEPEILKKYYEAVKNGPPKFCHTCEEYADDGTCLKYDMEPPEDFARTPGKCTDWTIRIPF